MKFCPLPWPEQLEQFTRYCEDRAVNRVIHGCMPEARPKKIIPDSAAVLSVLLRQEAQQPGSIVIRVARTERTAIVVGRNMFGALRTQGELKLP
jgi:hypothetical protein